MEFEKISRMSLISVSSLCRLVFDIESIQNHNIFTTGNRIFYMFDHRQEQPMTTPRDLKDTKKARCIEWLGPAFGPSTRASFPF